MRILSIDKKYIATLFLFVFIQFFNSANANVLIFKTYFGDTELITKNSNGTYKNCSEKTQLISASEQIEFTTSNKVTDTLKYSAGINSEFRLSKAELAAEIQSSYESEFNSNRVKVVENILKFSSWTSFNYSVEAVETWRKGHIKITKPSLIFPDTTQKIYFRVLENINIKNTSINSIGSCCRGRKFNKNEQRISTNESDARVFGVDSEIDSDDWTSVFIKYEIRYSQDKRGLDLFLNWHAQERNRNRTKGNTKIESTKKIKLFHLGSNCPSSRIIGVTGIQFNAQNEDWYRGKVHHLLPFKEKLGSLKNIKVRFDKKGRDDHRVQKLIAEFPSFSVEVD